MSTLQDSQLMHWLASACALPSHSGHTHMALLCQYQNGPHHLGHCYQFNRTCHQDLLRTMLHHPPSQHLATSKIMENLLSNQMLTSLFALAQNLPSGLCIILLLVLQTPTCSLSQSLLFLLHFPPFFIVSPDLTFIDCHMYLRYIVPIQCLFQKQTNNRNRVETTASECLPATTVQFSQHVITLPWLHSFFIALWSPFPLISGTRWLWANLNPFRFSWL